MRAVAPVSVLISTARTWIDPIARATAAPVNKRAPAALAAASMLAETLARGSTTAATAITARPEVGDSARRVVVVAEHDCAAAGRHRESVEIRAHRAGQHDAGTVVVAEHQGRSMAPAATTQRLAWMRQ
jgi:hypothetical protein